MVLWTHNFHSCLDTVEYYLPIHHINCPASKKRTQHVFHSSCGVSVLGSQEKCGGINQRRGEVEKESRKAKSQEKGVF